MRWCTLFERGTPVRDELLILLSVLHTHDTTNMGDDGFQNEGKGRGDQAIACNVIIENDEYNDNEHSAAAIMK